MLRFLPSRILRSAAQSAPARATTDWSKTLNLPKSTFPARPTAAHLETYRQRCADDLYSWQRQQRPNIESSAEESVKDEFVLHDGPPYANGAVHAGHALNKILKDIIVRSELAQGKRVRYQPGWDCHGLPIELKALQQRSSSAKDKQGNNTSGAGVPSAEIRQTASQLAARTIEEQKEEFRSWNVMGEWDAPYKTMDKDFEIRQLGVFKEMVKKGLIFRDHRPVYWSPSSRTALAEAELEYDDKHTCTAAFVKLPLMKLPEGLKSRDAVRADRISALIWTTTPWTLPANKAVAFNPEIEYTVIEIQSPETSGSQADQLLLGKERVEHVLAHLSEGTTVKIIVDSVPGSQLLSDDAACYNVFQAAESRFVAADFVSATSGTGLVHMAPGHGMEDYQVCQSYNIGPAFAPVDGEGRFTPDAFPAESTLTGVFTEGAGVKAVLEILRSPTQYLPSGFQMQEGSLLLKSHKFVHKNPIDWRTKEPVIVRATAQWFADVSLIKERALRAIEPVRFIPESGRTRLKAFIEGRNQWCISRQRAWGVPIPALYHRETGEACISEASLTHIIDVIRERGTDAWFSDPADESAWIHSSLDPGMWVRGTDTMDVWFDSGTTWTSLSERGDNEPLADIYVEGSDQHRGWFQSSLLTAVATQDPTSVPLAPYSTLLTHGFILDSEGRKMSKSLGNVISPAEIVSGSLLQQPTTKAGRKGKVPVAQPVQKGKKKQDAFGPDLLRLWVASSDYTKDVPISQQGLLGVQQALQKYRVTMKFLNGVLADYNPVSPSVDSQDETDWSFADRAIRIRLVERAAAIRKSYNAYRFHEGVREINAFVNTDLSAFYFEVAKDPLYTGLRRDRVRVQNVLAAVQAEMLNWLAPLTPALVEEVWAHMPDRAKEGREHPLKRVWSWPLSLPRNMQLAHKTFDFEMSTFDSLSRAVKVAQENARAHGKLGSGLACRVRLCLLDNSSNKSAVAQLLTQRPSLEDQLASLLVVSEVDVVRLPTEQMASRPGSQVEDIAPDADWVFEALVEEGTLAGGSVVCSSKVQILPPRKEKCIRCWNYVAEEKEGVCGRCVEAVREKEEAGQLA